MTRLSTRSSLVAALLAAAASAGLLTGGAPAGATGAGPRSLPPAPVWTMKPGAMPTRPASCPPLPKATGKQTPSKASELGSALWPAPPPGANPERYALDDRTKSVWPPSEPSNWDDSGSNWMLTAQRSTDKAINTNPQELCGVEGNSDDLAWQTTTGNPTTVVAVLDSGIEWCDPATVDRIAINRSVLPLPENSRGLTKPQLEADGVKFPDTDPYDLNRSGVFDAPQYAGDPRVAAVAKDYGGYYCAKSADNLGSGYTGITAEDLIRTFGTATLPNGKKNPYYLDVHSPNGYQDAIAGWNFLDNDNNPTDDVAYGHGTGEAEDIAGSANTLSQEVGACPDCMILPVRVGTSFISTGNMFAEGVLFAVDSGATSISEALGTVNETSTDSQAIAYAASHGVPIVGSAADEESEHDNLPAGLGGIIDVNSTTQETSWDPPSSLYLNGCTNYGPEISVTVESSSCSSEATGKASGTVGLLESEAADAVAAGTMKDYPGLKSATGAPVPLSANEVMQLVTMSADDVNFATAAPNASPPAPADNYAVSGTGIPFGKTTMYPTTPGYDEYTGWGRLDAARIVQWVKEGRIPPEAQITSPAYFETFTPTGSLSIVGRVAAVRSTSYKYQIDVAPGAAPAASAWRLAAEGTGTKPKSGVLASIPLASLAALWPGGAASLSGGPVTGSGSADPDKFTFTVRILVEDAHGLVGVAQTADFLHSDPSLLAGYPKQVGSSIDAPTKLAPIGPGGEDVLLVPESGGEIAALLPNGHELPGWPVYTNALPYHPGEEAFTSGAVTDVPRGEIIGGVAVGDLADATGKSLDVVTTDEEGYAYAWNSAGKLLPGWPVRTNPAFSEPSARNAENRLLPGLMSAPALGDLEGNGQLDVIASSLDRHVYAWQPSGHAVPGWPVLVVDPSEVASVSPVTNEVTFKKSADPDIGSELVDTPAVARLTKTGPPEVIVGADEEYAGTADANLGLLGSVLGSSLNESNSRVYAIYPNGSLHRHTGTAPPGLPDPGAFLPGWPVKIGDLVANLLPTVGDGIVSSPAVGSLVPGQLDVVTFATAGPVYELAPSGKSVLGSTDGEPNVLAFSPPGTSVLSNILTDSIPALGGAAIAPLGPAGAKATPSVIAPAASVGRLLDELEPGEQSPSTNQVVAWSGTSGQMLPGYPGVMNDLQFFAQPTVADVDGPAAGGYVMESSGLYDVRAYGANGAEAPGFPKFIGGWVTGGATTGPFGTYSAQVMAVGTRTGELDIWHLPALPACASPGPWAQSHHDLWNTDDLSQTGTPAYKCAAKSAGQG
ncbi:MAG: S8 family serine peptidase [Acidimicrobiales bacterium]